MSATGMPCLFADCDGELVLTPLTVINDRWPYCCNKCHRHMPEGGWGEPLQRSKFSGLDPLGGRPEDTLRK